MYVSKCLLTLFKILKMEITNRQLEIVEAASRLLTNSGISGLTIKNLAKEMHFTESAIYRHFVSKEEIVLALLHFLAQNVDQRLAAINPSLSPTEKLKALFDLQFKFFSQNPHFIVAVLSDGLLEENPKINQAIRVLMDTKQQHIYAILKAGVELNCFSDRISVEDMTQIVLGTFKVQIFKWKLANFSYDLVQQGNQIVDSLLKLIS